MLVCAGTRDLVSTEDALGAGAVIDSLVNEDGAEEWISSGLSAAHLAHSSYLRERTDLKAALSESQNGKRLIKLGLGRDIEWCAREDVFNVVPVWNKEFELRCLRVL